ncbi:MAG: hypothetical protein AB8B85_08030 [Paracoccaceae bacterium]
MHDWFVTVLVSVRDMAAKSGMAALAEEMDIAILVAANEAHEKEIAELGKVDVRPPEADIGNAREPSELGTVRRYH